MLENRIAIVGYSGHSYVVVDSYLSTGKLVNYYSDIKKASSNPYNLEYLGSESDPEFKGWQMPISYILGIGDNIIREKAANLILSNSKKIESVIHPNSSISNSVKLGVGVFVSNGALVNAFASIGDFVILNTGCIVEHECELATAVHIAPGAVIAGNVKIGKRTFIGANSTIKQGVEIGENVIIGAGSVILKNVASNSKIVGNPGRIIQ